MLSNDEFITKAENIYNKYPLKFGAFWKYREHLKVADVYEKVIDRVTHMYAVNKTRLVYYWSEDSRIIIDRAKLKDFDILRLNGRYRDEIAFLSDTHKIHEGITQIYDKNFVETKNNSDYYTDYFDFSDKAYDEAFDIYNDGDGKMSLNHIKSLTKASVFDPSLWVLVREKKSNRAVSMGISVYDNILKETELEWIAVKKEHWGKGVGRMLIAETVRRSKVKSNIIRVGGIVDDFYFKCGFQIQSEKGLWIFKNNTKVSWWD